jgi:hypothetical protein
METITTDLCELDFPPELYGEDPEAVEATIQAVVEKVFRDEDGMIRSGVYGKTMKPLRLEDVRDRPHAIGCYSENHHIPNELKPIYNNYENAGQCSGKYIRAMLNKYSVNQDNAILDYARRTFKAIELLWNNVAQQNSYPGGRGWMPKPFGGIRHVAEMTECSPDQYTDMTLGLERFYHEAADENERQIIEEMIVSFADWWALHDYATSYEGGTCWWKLRPDCIHVVSYFLYLNTLAHRFNPCERYQTNFKIWLNVLDESLKIRDGLNGANMIGLTIECMDRLMELKPDYNDLWLKVISDDPDTFVKRLLIEDQDVAGLSYQQLNCFAAYYLCVAARVLNEPSFKGIAKELIEAYNKRRDFYHISRGKPVDKLLKVVTGDDYRNIFWAEGHILWLATYWVLKDDSA